MRWSLILSVCATLAAGPALAQQKPAPPSVLITTVPPRMGTVPRLVVGYGVVQAAPGGSQTLSVLRATQVRQVLVSVGQTVRQGQTLMVLEADPSAIATYKQAVAALTLAQGERSRLGQMLNQHLATRDQVAQAAKAVSDAQANLDALRSAGGGTAMQTVRAGFDGVVAALPVAPGARVPAQGPLVVLDRSNNVVVSVGVESSQRVQVAIGQKARIETLDGGSKPQDGTVQAVSGMLDPATRLVPIQIQPATGSVLLQGGPVRASVVVGEVEGWTVPRAAVLTDAQGAYVFQTAAGKAKRVDVRVAGMSGDETVVTGPIDPAQPIVSSGNYQLQDGLAVRTGDAAASGVAAK